DELCIGEHPLQFIEHLIIARRFIQKSRLTAVLKIRRIERQVKISEPAVIEALAPLRDIRNKISHPRSSQLCVVTCMDTISPQRIQWVNQQPWFGTGIDITVST